MRDQRGAHVLRHRLGVAADVEARAALQPVDDLAPPLAQPVLDVDLLGRVAREGEVEPRQRAVGEGVLPFELVEEIVREAAVAEEQPVAAAGADGAALLHEGAERRDAGARGRP